jgi:hypothetical protein
MLSHARQVKTQRCHELSSLAAPCEGCGEGRRRESDRRRDGGREPLPFEKLDAGSIDGQSVGRESHLATAKYDDASLFDDLARRKSDNFAAAL